MLPQDTGSSPPLTSRSQPGSLQVAAILGTSKQLEVDSAGQRVRRTSPLDPETAMAEVDARSIYAKPFPFDVTLDGLMQFWNTVAPTRGVRLRRHAVSLDFKGSIFVEFDCCATADQVCGQLQGRQLLPDLRQEHARLPVPMCVGCGEAGSCHRGGWRPACTLHNLLQPSLLQAVRPDLWQPKHMLCLGACDWHHAPQLQAKAGALAAHHRVRRCWARRWSMQGLPWSWSPRCSSCRRRRWSAKPRLRQRLLQQLRPQLRSDLGPPDLVQGLPEQALPASSQTLWDLHLS